MFEADFLSIVGHDTLKIGKRPGELQVCSINK